jgi:hypothetical protein
MRFPSAGFVLLASLLLACHDPEPSPATDSSSGGSSGQAGGGNAGQGQAGSGQAGSGQAGSGQAGSGQAGSGNAGSGQAGGGNAGGGQAGGGQAGSGPAGGTNIEKACAALVARYGEEQAVDGRGPLPPVVTGMLVASCVTQVTLPGVTITAADLATCAAQPLFSQAPLPCLDYSGIELFPQHDRTGTLAAGATCSSGIQCASGRCSGDYANGTCGICQENRQAGEPCANPATACPVGMICNEGFCAFSGTNQGKPCNTYGGGDCRLDLYCKPLGPVFEGSCQPRVGLGGACDPDTACQNELFCLAGSCAARSPDGVPCPDGVVCQNDCHEGACASPRNDAPAGADCSFDYCGVGLACIDEVCVAVPQAKEGEKCGPAGCEPGLLCDSYNIDSPTAGRCVPVPALGEGCVDFQCGPLGTCNTDKSMWGTCEARGFEGEPGPCVVPLFWGQDDHCHAHHPCP